MTHTTADGIGEGKPGTQPEHAEGLRGDLGVSGILMQAIGHMGPATGIAFSASGIIALTLLAAPVAFLIAGVIVMLLGICLTQLARHLPSAGGYFTFVSRGVGPRAGFFTAWLYFLYDPLLIAAVWTFAAKITESALQTEFGWNVPWWVIWCLGILAVTLLSYRGVSISARVVVVLGVLEILIVAALAIHGLADPGPGGFSFAPFDPGEAPDLNALYLGVIFGIFLFTGFETVAPLAEETRDPRRTLPRGIIWSLVITIMVYVFCTWGVIVGWGVDDVESLGADGAPLFTLGERLWSGGWLLLLFAVLNSVLAVSIAAQNASTRVFFAMARVGVLPKPLSKIHPKFRTPVGAIAFQTVITVLVGLIGGLWLGPIETLVFIGLALTLAMVLVYSLGNLAVWRLYRGELRREFKPLLHLVLPLVSSVAMLWVGFKSGYPLPEGDTRWAPVLVVFWVVLGVLATLWVGRPENRHWMERAGKVMEEHD